MIDTVFEHALDGVVAVDGSLTIVGWNPAAQRLLGYTRDEGIKWGATFALDLMVWPWPERKFGWFVEPAYTINQDNERSLSVSVGLLIAMP